MAKELNNNYLTTSELIFKTHSIEIQRDTCFIDGEKDVSYFLYVKKGDKSILVCNLGFIEETSKVFRFWAYGITGRKVILSYFKSDSEL